MITILRNAWKIDDLRRKILYTLLILVIYRIGAFIPVPGINNAYVATQVGQNQLLSFLDQFSGGSLQNYTLFAMGISPYINASIIMNLLTVAIPRLERLAKEGEDGRKKIAQYTRYFTVILAFVQAIGIILGMGPDAVISTSIWNYITIGLCLTAGTAFVMWLGEKITESGIGNGMSLLIFAGIVARLPWQFIQMFRAAAAGQSTYWAIAIVVVVMLLIVAGVVFVDQGQRRVPVQYAKRVVGRKMYGGQSTHIPIRLNSSGVLPLIFAMTLTQFPAMIASFWPQSGFYVWYSQVLGSGSVLYAIFYALLIIFFTYFYTAISFNPVDISKNMQQNGGFIPGIRPGKATSDYLHRISTRITLFGALFLAILASVPTLFSSATNAMGLQFAMTATGILIMVNVALETSKQLESQMLMRHYKGFLK